MGHRGSPSYVVPVLVLGLDFEGGLDPGDRRHGVQPDRRTVDRRGLARLDLMENKSPRDPPLVRKNRQEASAKQAGVDGASRVFLYQQREGAPDNVVAPARALPALQAALRGVRRAGVRVVHLQRHSLSAYSRSRGSP